jgi:CheY-like chemotaxis protein
MEDEKIKRRILVVDDEMGLTQLVKLNLDKTGKYEVRTENKGRQAWAAAREFKPDLILLDIIMPDMDGGDVETQFHRDPQFKNIPIIFFTATVPRTGVGGTVIWRGGERFLAKPVSPATLIKCIEEALSRPEEQQMDRKPLPGAGGQVSL